MKVYLSLPDGPQRLCSVAFAGCASVEPAGTCPRCGCADFRTAGRNMRIAADDRAYESDAYALCCGERVGTLRAEMDTLFGVREDEAVLHGRCRVY